MFMVICSFYFGFLLMIRVLIDDVPFDVELQIKRNDFLNSKIIDHARPGRHGACRRRR